MSGASVGDKHASTTIDPASRCHSFDRRVAFLSSRSERSDAIAVAVPSEQTPKDIPDQKLDAAATALEQVASVKEDYQRRIKAADPSDRNRIAEEAHNALVKAVTDRGLSVEEYTSILQLAENDILQLAENDPGVREKLLQRIHPPAD